MTEVPPNLVAGTGDYSYDVVRPFGTPPPGMTFGFLDAWGEGRLRDAHGIYVGPDGHVYVCNRDEHEVLKLTRRGRSA